MSITKEQLNLAAWFSITSAAIAIPIVGLYTFLEVAGRAVAKAINAILNLVSLGRLNSLSLEAN